VLYRRHHLRREEPHVALRLVARHPRIAEHGDEGAGAESVAQI
jgi:hypothetical protein